MKKMPTAFEILGPITVGPSTSHRTGPIRIANFARALTKGKFKKANILLWNSLAATWVGHGTHTGIIGGLIGYTCVNHVEIENAITLAKKSGHKFHFDFGFDDGRHPNEVEIVFENSISIVGNSIGAGMIIIKSINGIECSIDGTSHVIVLNANRSTIKDIDSPISFSVNSQQDMTILISDTPFNDTVFSFFKANLITYNHIPSIYNLNNYGYSK